MEFAVSSSVPVWYVRNELYVFQTEIANSSFVFPFLALFYHSCCTFKDSHDWSNHYLINGGPLYSTSMSYNISWCLSTVNNKLCKKWVYAQVVQQWKQPYRKFYPKKVFWKWHTWQFMNIVKEVNRVKYPIMS